MVVLRQGDHVWVDSGTGVLIGAEVKLSDTGQLLLIDDEGKEHWVSGKTKESIRPMHPTSVKGVDDMIRLGDLNEAGLLRNLMIRHKEGIIYTYTGSILVAVNPYQLLPLYTADHVHRYTNRRLGELPPHVFAIADSCYFNMRRNRKDQCCIISGESGAGKTESTKLMLQFLAAVSGQHSWIEQQILEANPILEAFGNAKTIRNDNSSRFGKYIDIYFNKSGVIEGARVDQYLLEKSRVCRQAPEERNYHIFYCMLMGMTAEQKNLLSLGNASEYSYLTVGNCTSCEGRDDIKEYAHIRSAMKILTFTDNNFWEITKLLAALLHLGNLDFEAAVYNNMESCDVQASLHFTTAAKLLEVNPKVLEVSLTNRSFMTNRESVSKPLSCEQAVDGRDAFVKAIYSRLFVWIVNKINSAVYTAPPADPSHVRQSIGLLDIFGFENFNNNSFEQLCINFANEQLQQFFVKHVFKLEQDEYAQENIGWLHIDFNDNQHTLDVLASKSLNILALIEEESHFPKATDTTMLNKINSIHGKSNIYLPPKSKHDMQFGIQHFAGAVYYNAKGFLEKNRDALSSDSIHLVKTSSNKLLKTIFEADLISDTVKTVNPKMIIKPKNSVKATDARKQVPTLSGQFRQSLDSLMKTLTACQPFFIRCIKPNDYKKPMLFDRDLCMRQLRYSGMMETIRIRKSGYPIRYAFDEFLERYHVLLKTSVCDPKKETPETCCSSICESVISAEGDWKIGKTKIFLKDYHDTMLELERDRALHEKATLIQRVLRGYKYRKRFVKQKKAAVVIQKTWRGHKCRKQYRVVQLGFARLQAQCRSRQLSHRYQQMREAAVLLQAHCRGYLLRKDCRRKREAVVVLQAHARGMLARRSVTRMKEEAHLSAQERLTQEMERRRQREEVLSRKCEASSKSESISEQEMVDNIFGFLPTTVHVVSPVISDLLPDLPASLTVWWIILRFMGDIPEPRQRAPENKGLGSLGERSIQEKLGQRQGRRLSHLVGLDQTLILLKIIPLDAFLCPLWRLSTRKSTFKKLLRRNKKAAKSSGGTRNKRQSVVQEEVRKTFLFTDLMKIFQILTTLHSCISEKEELSIYATMTFPAYFQPVLQPLKEEDDVLVGEGPTLDRPMTALEKLHFIVGNGIVRRNIRDEIYCQICKQLVENGNQSSYFRGWILLSLCLGIFPPSERLSKYLLNFIRSGPAGYAPYCVERLRRTLTNGVRGEPPTWMELQATKTKKPIVVSVTLMDGRMMSVPLDSASTAQEVCKFIAQKIKLSDIFGFSVYIAIYEKVWSLGGGKDHVLDAISQCEQEVKRQGGQEQHAPWRLYFRKEIFTPWHDCSIDSTSTDLIYRQLIRGIRSGEYQCDKEDDMVQLAAKHFYVQFGSDSGGDNAKKVVQDCINNSLLEAKSEAKWIQLVGDAYTKSPYIKTKINPDTVKAEVIDFGRHKWPLFFSRFFEVVKFSGPALPKNTFIVAINWTSISFVDEKERVLLVLSYPEVVGVNTSRSEKTHGQTVTLATLKGDFVLNSPNAANIADLLVMFLEGLKERSQYAVALQEASKQVLLKAIIAKHVTIYYTCYKIKKCKPKKKRKCIGKKNFALFVFLSPYNLGTTRFHLYELTSCSSLELINQSFVTENREKERDLLLKHSSLFLCVLFQATLIQCEGKLLQDSILIQSTHNKEGLRDEVYCQIMKQMTDNHNRYSIENGWQLLWLCCGLFPPSQALLKHAQRFLESRRREPLAADCLQRMQAALRAEPRKLPPHQVEIDAIQQMSTQIFHKVHFPNDTEEIFEVGSHTRIRDLCHDIAAKLNLISADGFSLFLKTPDKVLSLNEAEYFFDSLRQITDWTRKVKRVKDGGPVNVPYLVFFMRKLWFNVTPGKDIQADIIFHYTQELPKYLRGYHRCSKEDMINIAALIFKLKFNNDKSEFVMIPKMLKELVPNDQLKLMSAEEWRKNIIASYNKHASLTVNDTKVAILKIIHRWPTFGCAFFEVKQTSEPAFPDIIMIAISKQGVTLIHPKSKDVLASYPFNKIANWCSGSTYFHMTIGNLIKGNKILCETSLGYKMDDLLTSYVTMYLNERNAVHARTNRFPA
uniref:Myosin VIIBb n=1 Tax=Lepisosteus oculatus TaxID=7918 RepID=W5MDG5_LEPOC